MPEKENDAKTGPVNILKYGEDLVEELSKDFPELEVGYGDDRFFTLFIQGGKKLVAGLRRSVDPSNILHATFYEAGSKGQCPEFGKGLDSFDESFDGGGVGYAWVEDKEEVILERFPGLLRSYLKLFR